MAAIPAVLLAVTVLPRLAMTYSHYGTAVVTTQTGNQAMDVVDQFLRRCPKCVAERRETRMHAALAARLASRDEADRSNPLVLDRIRRDVAFEYLKELPPLVVVEGTVAAAIRSTLQTGLYEVGYQLNLEPTFFSSVPGSNLSSRLASFSSTISGDGFMSAWALAQAAALIGFAFQLTGTVGAMRDPRARPFILFLLAIAAYFVALNGPFGNPRYGMPLAPTLIVLTIAGGFTILDRFPWRLRQA